MKKERERVGDMGKERNREREKKLSELLNSCGINLANSGIRQENIFSEKR